jgi:hypothetical protein
MVARHPDPLALEVFSYGDSKKFGWMLECLVILGHRTLVTDLDTSKDIADAERIPLRDARDALHRHHFGHRHAGGANPN